MLLLRLFLELVLLCDKKSFFSLLYYGCYRDAMQLSYTAIHTGYAGSKWAWIFTLATP